jgi:capping protein beta
MDKAKVNICINFTKKLPVENIEKNIDKLSVLLNKKELIKEFVQKSDRQLVVSREDSLGDFIKSEFNCEFDSYRSPHSNKYFPPRENAKFPPSELRELEIILNKIFKEYTKLYYGNTAIPSVYVWEQGESIDNGFYCALLIKNSVGTLRGLEKAEWDSVNIVNIKFSNEKERYIERIKATYKIYTNIIFKFKASNINTEWSGSISRQV